MPRCGATTSKGLPCKAFCMKGKEACIAHANKTAVAPVVVETEIEDTSCSICYDVMKTPAKLECKHEFCNACISEWFAKAKKTCPCCRAVVSDAKIVEITGKPVPAVPIAPMRSGLPAHGMTPEMQQIFISALYEPIPEDASRETLINIAYNVMNAMVFVRGGAEYVRAALDRVRQS